MHARNAIAKPRLATSIRRMTAMLNFLVELRKWGGPFSQAPPERYLLNSTIANIQLDVEKAYITSPDLSPATATSETPIAEHSSAVLDIVMGEHANLGAQPKNARFLLALDRTHIDFSNSDS